MKNKILITLILACFALSASAQDTTKFVYCRLFVMQKMMSFKIIANVDQGQSTKENADIMDTQTGKPKEFNSDVDALNYMAESGWEPVLVYIEIIAQGSAPRWVLRRKR